MTSGGFFDDPVDTGGGFAAAVALGGAAASAIGAINQKAIDATRAETQKLVAVAKSGGFRISEEGMAPLRDAIDKMEHRLATQRQNINRLAQSPRLGSHPYGVAVASHDQKSAANELGSAGVVLEQFSEVLRQAREAIERAAGVYKENEEQARGVLGNGS